jgi:lycopene cyclase domain-containing protein
VRFPCRKSPEPPLRRNPKSGIGPAGMVPIVAFSDGVDRKTENKLSARNLEVSTCSSSARTIRWRSRLALYGWEVGDLDHFQYLLLMAACLLITLPLEFVLGARVYRRAAGLAFAVIPVVIIFSVWDIVGILRDHWSYSPRFTTGVKLIFGMPIEELVFFIVVPICGLLTYEAVGQMLRLVRRRSPVGEGDPHA